jgi:uncharacterized membrane protein YesL
MKKKDPYYEKLDKEFVQKYKSNKWIDRGWTFLGIAGALFLLYVFTKPGNIWFLIASLVFLIISLIMLFVGYRKKKRS